MYPSSLPNIDLQVLPTFPAHVGVTGVLTLVKSGLSYTFGVNFQNVAEETNVSDMSKREVLVQDTDTGAFWRIKLANLPPSPHTHPVSQISDATPLGQALVTALDTATAQATLNVPPNTRTISAGTGLTGGGDLSADRTLALASVGSNQILANLTGSTAAPTGNSLSAILDTITSTRGSILYRGASGWAALPPGTSGQVLTTFGAGADPSWQTATAAAIDAGILGGFRNKIINGNFDIWQRGTSLAAPGYLADRWRWTVDGTGGVAEMSRQPFLPGQADVPGEPEYYLRFGFTTASTGQTYNVLTQRIEGVRTLAGKRATLTFWAKTEEAPFALDCNFVQDFGTGGSPSAQVRFGAGSHNIGNAWQKFQAVIDIPSIAGKIIGSNGDDYLGLEMGLPPNSTARLLLARVSLVEGDATAEADPFSPRHIQQELALCQRYYYKASSGLSYPFRGYNFRDISAAVSVGSPHPVKMRSTPSASFEWEVNDVARAGSPEVVALSADGWCITQAVDVGGSLDIIAVTMDAEL